MQAETQKARPPGNSGDSGFLAVTEGDVFVSSGIIYQGFPADAI
jgi:hypothetical protein